MNHVRFIDADEGVKNARERLAAILQRTDELSAKIQKAGARLSVLKPNGNGEQLNQLDETERILVGGVRLDPVVESASLSSQVAEWRRDITTLRGISRRDAETKLRDAERAAKHKRIAQPDVITTLQAIYAAALWLASCIDDAEQLSKRLQAEGINDEFVASLVPYRWSRAAVEAWRQAAERVHATSLELTQ